MSKTAEKIGESIGRGLGWALMIVVTFVIYSCPIVSYVLISTKYPAYTQATLVFWLTVILFLSIGKIMNARKQLLAQKQVTDELNAALHSLRQTGVDLNEAVVQQAFNDLTTPKH
jgi:hypothetical protein